MVAAVAGSQSLNANRYAGRSGSQEGLWGQPVRHESSVPEEPLKRLTGVVTGLE